MTAVATSPGPDQATDERRALWAIARYESLRLIRHPVLLVAALLFIYGTVEHALQRVRQRRRTTHHRTAPSPTSTTRCRPRSCSGWVV